MKKNKKAARDPWGWEIQPSSASLPVHGDSSHSENGGGLHNGAAIKNTQGPSNRPFDRNSVDAVNVNVNVFHAMTSSEVEEFDRFDKKTSEAWSGFMSARDNSSAPQVGDTGSAVWFASSAAAKDEAVLSLVMRVGLPREVRRKVWKIWASKARNGDDAHASTGLLTWKKFQAEAEQFLASSQKSPVRGEGSVGADRPSSLLSQSTYSVICADLKRTLNTHPLFMPNAAGLISLEKILVACALADEQVGYLQGMNFLGAFLILAFKQAAPDGDLEDVSSLEEDVFLVLQSFTTSVLKNYYTPGLPSLLRDAELLNKLLKVTDPDYYEHLCSIGFDLNLVFPQWSICAFISSTPMTAATRIWDLILYANAASPGGGGGGIMVWLGMSIMHALRSKLMVTNSICRAITEIRKFTTTDIREINRDLYSKAGLSVHSFIDTKKLRESIENMCIAEGRVGGVNASRKRRMKDEAKEASKISAPRVARSGVIAAPWETPMTKKRKAVIQSFAQKNGITREQAEGKFLFSPGDDGRKGSGAFEEDAAASNDGGLVDRAENFFKFAATLMTPTPAKKPKRRRVEEGNLSRRKILGSIGNGTLEGGENAPSAASKENNNGEFCSPEAKKRNHDGVFFSPNSKGFEMTPIGKGSAMKRRASKKKKKPPLTPHGTHFFTSPEGHRNAPFTSPEVASNAPFASPVRSMR